MSDFFYINLTDAILPPMSPEEVERFVRERCRRVVPNNMLQSFRVAITIGGFGLQIEPFIGGASFRALYHAKAKRNHLRPMIAALVDWANTRSSAVGLLFIRQTGLETPRIHQTRGALEDVLSKKRLPSNTLIILGPQGMPSSRASPRTDNTSTT